MSWTSNASAEPAPVAPPPSVDDLLRNARVIHSVRGVAARRDVLSLTSAAVELLHTLPGLPERFGALLDAAELLDRVGARRKRSMMLWLAFKMTSGTDGKQLAQQAQLHMQLHAAATHARQASSSSCSSAFSSTASWDTVQMCLLQASMASALAAGALPQAWHAASQLLHDHHALLAQSYQEHLADTLLSVSTKMAVSGEDPGPSTSGLGIALRLVQVLPLPKHTQPVLLQFAGEAATDGSSGPAASVIGQQTAAGTGGGGSVLLYNPYAKSRQEKAAAAGEAQEAPSAVRCSVQDHLFAEVAVSNPLGVPVMIDELCLHVEPVLPDSGVGSDSTSGTTAEAAAAPPPLPPQAPETGSSTRQSESFGKAPDGGAGGSALSAGGGAVLNGAALRVHIAPESLSPAAGGSGPGPPTPTSPTKASAGWKCVPLPMMEVPPGQSCSVYLSICPLQPGTGAIVGCRLSMWGLQWVQSLSPPKSSKNGVSSGGGGGSSRGAAAPTLGKQSARQQQQPAASLRQHQQLANAACVLSVLPRLTSVKASLTGPGVPRLPRPTSDVGPLLPGSADAPESVSTVHIFEGQSLTWSLTVRNAGPEDIEACEVVVADDAGRPVAVAAEGVMTAGTSAAVAASATTDASVLDVSVSDALLKTALPLGPDQSASAAVFVRAGWLHDRPMAVRPISLLVRHAALATASLPGVAPAAAAQPAGPKAWGRVHAIPLKLCVQPALSIQAMQFVATVATTADDAGSTTNTNTAAGAASGGCLQLLVESLVPEPIQVWLAGSATQRWAEPSPAAAAVGGGGGGGDKDNDGPRPTGLCAPVELQPGRSGMLQCDLASLRQLLASCSVPPPCTCREEAVRSWCVQQLCGALALCWQAAQAGPQAPGPQHRGSSRLLPAQVAASLTRDAAVRLVPDPVTFSVILSGCSSGSAAQLQDIELPAGAAAAAAEAGSPASASAAAPRVAKGLCVSAGATLPLLAAGYNPTGGRLDAVVSVRVHRAGDGNGGGAEDGAPPLGVLMAGRCQQVRLPLAPGLSAQHPFGLLFAMPGLYRVCVAVDSLMEELAAPGSDDCAAAGESAAAVLLHVTDNLIVLCK